MSVAIRPRLAADVSMRKLAGARGLVVNGPRQSGKSELLRMLRRRLGGTLLTLDEPQHLRLAGTDPTGFVQDRTHPLMIDEVQRGGDPLAGRRIFSSILLCAMPVFHLCR